MLCPYCGSEVASGNAFCTNCGAQIPAAGAPEPPQNPAPAQIPAPSYQPYQQQGPAYAGAGGATVADMPSKGVAIALIVIGFLCGVIWGIVGIFQYGPMKQAIELGDAATAKRKFRNIVIATGIGIAFNVLFVASGIFVR